MRYRVKLWRQISGISVVYVLFSRGGKRWLERKRPMLHQLPQEKVRKLYISCQLRLYVSSAYSCGCPSSTKVGRQPATCLLPVLQWQVEEGQVSGRWQPGQAMGDSRMAEKHRSELSPPTLHSASITPHPSQWLLYTPLPELLEEC